MCNFFFLADQRDTALGTGCVIRDQQGTCHAFYTGHNDFREPKETVMYAASSDMLSWTKHPEESFTAEIAAVN